MVDNQSNGGHMALNKSVVSSVVRSVVRSVVGIGEAITQRFFTTTAAAGSQHYTIPTVTLTGDFDMPFEFTMPTVAPTSDQWILGTSGSAPNLVGINSTGLIRQRFGGGSLNNSGIVLPLDGKLHKGRVRRESGVITVSVDDINGTTTVNTTAAITWDRFGTAGGGTQFFSGIVANVQITDAGTLIRNYKIDEDWTTSTVLHDSSGNNQHGTSVNITSADAGLFTQQSNGDWLGEELSQVPASIELDGLSGADFELSFTAVSGKTYRIGTEITNYTGVGDIGYANGGGVGNAARRPDNGPIALDFLSTGGGILLFADNNKATFLGTTGKQLLEKA